MADRVVVLAQWPQPDAGAPLPRIAASDRAAALRYTTSDGRTATVSFSGVMWLSLGLPNDETLNSHPLYQAGLQPYAVHQVFESSTIAELEARNAVHPDHQASRFAEARHFVFTFHDSTCECVVGRGEPQVRVHANQGEADRYWEALSEGR